MSRKIVCALPHNAKVCKGKDEGGRWELVQGLPGKIHSNIDMFQVVTLDVTKALAIIDNSYVYFSEDAGKRWEKLPGHFPRRYTALLLKYTTRPHDFLANGYCYPPALIENPPSSYLNPIFLKVSFKRASYLDFP
jgi:hypothetical protein